MKMSLEVKCQPPETQTVNYLLHPILPFLLSEASPPMSALGDLPNLASAICTLGKTLGIWFLLPAASLQVWHGSGCPADFGEHIPQPWLLPALWLSHFCCLGLSDVFHVNYSFIFLWENSENRGSKRPKIFRQHLWFGLSKHCG